MDDLARLQAKLSSVDLGPTLSIYGSLAAALMRDRGRKITSLVQVTSSGRSEEHTSELQSLMRISYAVFCLKKKKQKKKKNKNTLNNKSLEDYTRRMTATD